MAKRGRKPKPEQDKRTRRLSVKFTVTEYELLQKNANKNLLSVSDFVRFNTLTKEK